MKGIHSSALPARTLIPDSLIIDEISLVVCGAVCVHMNAATGLAAKSILDCKPIDSGRNPGVQPPDSPPFLLQNSAGDASKLAASK
jgi:hypothetical protein